VVARGARTRATARPLPRSFFARRGGRVGQAAQNKQAYELHIHTDLLKETRREMRDMAEVLNALAVKLSVPVAPLRRRDSATLASSPGGGGSARGGFGSPDSRDGGGGGDGAPADGEAAGYSSASVEAGIQARRRRRVALALSFSTPAECVCVCVCVWVWFWVSFFFYARQSGPRRGSHARRSAVGVGSRSGRPV
jgi:hypothetical protein